jgi:terminase large subunit-like protein
MSKHVTRMTIDDALHLSPKQRQIIIESYPEHEREARTKGIPSLGSGRVFPVAEEAILCDPFPIPEHWHLINGLDFGWDHPFAATKCAWNKDDDIWYVIAAYREKTTTPPIHAAAVKPWGDWIPCAWPHDGLQHDKGSGKSLADQYREQGLYMLDEMATHEAGGNGIEAGITDMLTRMLTGRFKVFRGLDQWMEEFRYYRRDDGLIVKERDDLISSTRYAMMMRRFAMQEPQKFRPMPKPNCSPWAM